jgi:formylglycine-generating enzyme required for sulfatase activity
MTTDDQSVQKLADIRELLLETFADGRDLRRFCQDRPSFEPILPRFGPAFSLLDMIDAVIDYCTEHLLLDPLREQVEQYIPPKPRPEAQPTIIAGGDIKNVSLIETGDITGSYNAIGDGAQLVINQIQAQSEIEELDRGIALAQRVLREAIEQKVKETAAAVERQARIDRRNPYKALHYYELEDAPFFYGRNQAIEALLDRIHQYRLTVLRAPSGAGKTSLLLAGVASRLMAAGHLPVHVRARDTNPTMAIKSAFLPDFEKRAETQSFVDLSLMGFLNRVRHYLGQSTLYLLLDQFEEFFIQFKESEQAAFADELADCLDRTGLDVRWVLALRKEYYSDLHVFGEKDSLNFSNGYYLRAFSPAEAREVIFGPAHRQGVSYEAGLVETILDHLAKEVQARDRSLETDQFTPPEVQLVCHTLFNELSQEEDPCLITYQLYEKERGRRRERGVRGILSSHLSRVLDPLRACERRIAEAILEALVSSQGTRQWRTEAALIDELKQTWGTVDDEAVRNVLGRLVDYYLLRRDKDEEDRDRYELVHDYLLTEIELDPEVKARKAAQELLAQEIQAHRQYQQALVSVERLDIIGAQAEHLALDADALELLMRSAVARGLPSDLWRDLAVDRGLTPTLAERWVGELEDPARADAAVTLLAKLSDAKTVSCLVDFISTPEVEGRPVSLPDLWPTHQRALVALARMDCRAAEEYLRGLTPDGYCLVPAGWFDMGSDERQDEKQRGPVWVNAFWIARSPVTVSDWRQFVEDTSYTERRHHRPDQEDHPAGNLTWQAALAYACWLADSEHLPVSLPTEAEWEKAAGWNPKANQMDRYPWGSNPDANLCNVLASGNKEPTPVGRYSPGGDSPCGAQDMAGNILEWTRSKYRDYPYDETDGRSDLSGSAPRVLRGGAFNLDIEQARCARRHQSKPGIALSNTGCRVCLRLVALATGEDSEPPASGPTPG